MPNPATRKLTAPIDDWTTLKDLSRRSLAEVWHRAFGRPIPPKLFRNTAIPLLAYRLQELQHGGLSAAAERHLASLLPKPDGKPAPRPVPRLRPGTRLLRTWQGRTYTVTVADNGFIWDGHTYRSLSSIARKITGTAWSGPAFFGLKQRPDARKTRA
jgi:hypothetical protein